MARVGITVTFCLSLFCLVSTVSAELSLDIIYDLLSRRIDHVMQETNNIKNGLVETKSAVNKIEKKIENIQANVSAAIIDLNKNMERVSESLINDKIEKVENRSESLINDKIKNMEGITESLNTEMKRQSVAMQKMLFTEKKLLRERVQNFENKFSTFDSDMKSQMTLMNTSMENSVNNMEQSMKKHQIEINTDLQYMMNATNQQIEVMDVEFRNMMEDSNTKVEETKSEIENQTTIKMKELKQEIQEKFILSMENINAVSQNILTRTSSNLQSVESEMSSKLTFLEREQESQEDNFGGQISRLNSRISEEEARKVAFSARLTTKRSYYDKQEKIIFDDVRYSYGGGYSSSTGIFTAPKSGTYLFTFNVQGISDKRAHVGLFVRAQWQTLAFVQDGSYPTGGNAGIAYLSYGDKAWIETVATDDKHYIWPYRTTFNGILID